MILTWEYPFRSRASLTFSTKRIFTPRGSNCNHLLPERAVNHGIGVVQSDAPEDILELLGYFQGGPHAIVMIIDQGNHLDIGSPGYMLIELRGGQGRIPSITGDEGMGDGPART